MHGLSGLCRRSLLEYVHTRRGAVRVTAVNEPNPRREHGCGQTKLQWLFYLTCEALLGDFPNDRP